MGSKSRWAALALLCTVMAAGCGFSNLSFTTDTRLHFVTPKSRALVQTPLQLAWVINNFQVVPPGTTPVSSHSGYFAVFIDRAPIRPGQTIDVVADKSCRRTPGCVNAGYLADRGVYVTSAENVTLKEVASLNSYQKVQLHEATVVLMNSAGHRIGESAWYLDFRMKEPGH